MQSIILSLPAELRVKIFKLTIQCDTIHITENGSTRCRKLDETICPGPSHCRDDSTLDKKKDHNGQQGRVGAMMRTCRQLYRELQPLLFEIFTLSFVTGKAFCQFADSHLFLSLPEAFVFSRLVQVHLDMGPAKYAETTINSFNEMVLKRLAVHATRLKRLELSFGHYANAASEYVPIRSRTLRHLLRLRGLDKLRLRIHSPPPGPCGGFHLIAARIQIVKRMQCLEEVLAHYICKTRNVHRGAGDTSSYTTKLAEVKASIEARIREVENSQEQDIASGDGTSLQAYNG